MSPRSSQRVDRRRRVLAVESRNEGEAITPRIFRGDSDGPTQRYNAAALQAINAPIAKYIPLRPFNLFIWFLIGLVPILGVLLLDLKRPLLARVLGSEATRPFDLMANGNLAAWLSSVTFAFAIAVMLGMYSVRRYRAMTIAVASRFGDGPSSLPPLSVSMRPSDCIECGKAFASTSRILPCGATGRSGGLAYGRCCSAA